MMQRVRKDLAGMEDVWHASVRAAKARNARTSRALASRAATSERRRATTVAANNFEFKAGRNNRFASGTAMGRNVEKGLSRQSVAPVLARRNPTASFLRRLPPKPQTSPIGKAIGMGELRRGLKAVKAAPKVVHAGFRQGATGAAKPKMGLSTATTMLGNRPLQMAGQAGKFVGENRGTVGLSAGIVSGSIVGGGLARRDVEKADKRKPHQRYELILRKTTPEEQHKERKANRIGGGILGGATGAMMGGYAGEMHYPPKNHGRYMLAGTAAGTGLGILAGHHAPRSQYTLDVDKERPVRKAHGDPEDARYARLGAGSAVLAAGGAGGLGYAAYDARRATKLGRSSATFAANNRKHAKTFSITEGRGANKVTREVKAIPPELKAYAHRLSRGGHMISGRGALAGAGGLAALGGAEALRRKAGERRWT